MWDGLGEGRDPVGGTPALGGRGPGLQAKVLLSGLGMTWQTWAGVRPEYALHPKYEEHEVVWALLDVKGIFKCNVEVLHNPLILGEPMCAGVHASVPPP